MNDTDRLDWLGEQPTRLNDLYWHMVNGGGETIRQGIDALVELSEDPCGSQVEEQPIDGEPRRLPSL